MSQRQMLINYVPNEECRIAIIEDGRLEELYHERASVESHVGNIYKGRITNVEPAIQAAFIDFGSDRNGFLHITDLHPKFFPGNSKEEFERVGKKTPHRDRPLIQHCLKRGQEIVVQVLKEGISTKGPTLTSYLSIPGRYLVMMPDMQRMGVSRKVEDDDARREVRKILDELDTPDDFGLIVRTAGMGRNKTELKRDLAYLTRLWKTIDARQKKVKVGELYVESDLIIRTLRDLFTTDIDRVVIDHPGAAKRACDFLSIINPRAGSKVFVYDEPTPLFHRFGIEKQIDTIHSRTVPMPGGGSLVIDQAEALVAIDVNSGRMRKHKDAETTAFKTNQEAVDEICRQLRLRDMGGVVVCDFIDMRDLKSRRTIEQQFRDNLKSDRAKTKVLPINAFGVLSLTRQRMRPSLNAALFNECTHCEGEGAVKNPESVVLHVMRRLALVIHRPQVVRVELAISPDVAFQLLNQKRKHLVLLEQKHNAAVLVRVHGKTKIDEVEITAYDDRGGVVNVDGTKQTLDELKLIPISKKTDLPKELLDRDDEQITHTEPEEKINGDSQLAMHMEGDDPKTDSQENADENAEGQGRKRRRRRGGRRRNKNRDRDDQQQEGSTAEGREGNDRHNPNQDPSRQVSDSAPGVETQEQSQSIGESDNPEQNNNEEGNGAGRKRRRRRRGRGRGRDQNRESHDGEPQNGDSQNAESHEGESSHNQPSGQQSDRQSQPQHAPDNRPEDRSDAPRESKDVPKDDSPPKSRPGGRNQNRNRRPRLSLDTPTPDNRQPKPRPKPQPQPQPQQDDIKPLVKKQPKEQPQTQVPVPVASEDAAPAKPKTTKKKVTRKKTTRKKTTKKVASKADSSEPVTQPVSSESSQDKPASRGYTNPRRKRSTKKATSVKKTSRTNTNAPSVETPPKPSTPQ